MHYSFWAQLLYTAAAMCARYVPKEFVVAFSFAQEQRSLVESIATQVENELGPSTVFFDEWYQHHIAGHDADVKLHKIYQQCALVV
jgi:hypothetical protein